MARRRRGNPGQCDLAISTVLSALGRAGLLEETAVVVTSDHGGHDHSHGTEALEDMTVPWVLAEPGVVEGHRLAGPLSIIGTAPSLLHQLGIERPTEWLGQAVRQALVAPEKRLEPLISQPGRATL